MKNVLVVMNINDSYKEHIVKETTSAIRFVPKQEVTDEDLDWADAVIGNLKPHQYNSHNLQWVQLESAGCENFLAIDENIVLCNATGAYGEAIAEHMVGSVLYFYKRFYQYHNNQQNHIWKNMGPVRQLAGSNVLCVGLGDIGSTFAKKMHALGANCYGVKRRMTECPEYVKHIYSFHNMDEIIPQCDIVALSLPSTPETYHIFDKQRLSLMKKDALLINVGRGNAIDTDALTEQLNKGWYTGVALDVFEQEPLPEDHPLWDFDNVQITPHVSGNYNMEYTLITLVNMMIDNINRFENGQPLQNQVDRTSGYTK